MGKRLFLRKVLFFSIKKFLIKFVMLYFMIFDFFKVHNQIRDIKFDISKKEKREKFSFYKRIFFTRHFRLFFFYQILYFSLIYIICIYMSENINMQQIV